MRAQGAAPGGGTPGHGRIDGDSQTLPHSGIPPHLAERLAAEQILSLREWAKLSPRRKRACFGITERHRRLLDELAKAVRT